MEMNHSNSVVLVYPRLRPDERLDQVYIPLSLVCLSGSLKARGREVRLIDLQQHEDYDALLKGLPGAPICFGLSVMVSFQIQDGARFSEAAHRVFPGVPVVWGGWFPTALPDIAIGHAEIDYLVRGQGEVTFSELVDALAAGRKPENVKGVVYKENGRIVKNPAREPVSPDDLPPIDYAVLDRSRSALSGGHASYISSVGCPNRCKFCDVALVFGHRWLALKAERVVEDLEGLVRDYGIRTIDFYDDNFFVNTARLRDIMSGILRKGLKIRWMANARADQFSRLTGDDLRLIREAGCDTLTFGAESGNQKTLDFLQKGITVRQVEEAARRLREHDIIVRYNFMVGVPGETPSDFQKTLKFILKLKRIHPALGIVFYYYIPIPETRLAEEDVRMGFKPPGTFEGWTKNVMSDITQPWRFRMDESLMVDKRDRFKAMCYYFWKGYLFDGPGAGTPYGRLKSKISRLLSRFRVRTNFYALPLEWRRFYRRH
jgi:radical SAM superfamily enzyme YgiQ (UPF0313 family)